MAGDSERRFEKIMGKLSPSPFLNPSTSSGGFGKKRTESGLRVSATNSTGLVPPCRPWDRGDLLRRLATFKAMTWFGKPQVVNPVNCARRGWINVEMDSIACEACGARLLFSTPSSWTLQQVEKAAAVFSLKLDNGHKLLCPWKDNTCDEALALFPPTPPSVLVDGYGVRTAVLLRLTALPVVSVSAIDYMRSPQLEQFLSQSSHPLVTLNNGMKLTDNPRSKDIVGASEDAAANQYFQAQKIISLCGWEPRLLPYVVDNKDLSSAISSETSTAQKNSTIIHTSSHLSDSEGRIDNLPSELSEHQCDPASVVLDCKFCGACVGLWAFATVQRPLESFSLIIDSDSQNESEASRVNLVSGTEAQKAESLSKGYIGTISKERPMVLNLTIAGGPPPTKQKFRPVVSFPIISRHLRAEIASSLGTTGCASPNASCGNQLNARSNSQIDVQSGQHTNDDGGFGVTLEGVGSLKRKRSETEVHVSESIDFNGSSHLEAEVHTAGNNLTIVEKSSTSPSNRRDIGEESAHTLPIGIDGIANYEENEEGDLQRRDINPEHDKEKTLHSETAMGESIEVGESVSATLTTNITINSSVAHGNNSVADLDGTNNLDGHTITRLDLRNSGGTCKFNGDKSDDPSNIASCSYTHSVDGDSDIQNLNVTKAADQNAIAVENMEVSAGRKEDANHALGNKIGEFDPIRQHRPFCPWIASADGKSLPGWKLTLSALIQQEKNLSSDSVRPDSPSKLLDEVDDPIISIRKLFSSPPSKRLKGAH